MVSATAELLVFRSKLYREPGENFIFRTSRPYKVPRNTPSFIEIGQYFLEKVAFTDVRQTTMILCSNLYLILIILILS